MQQMTSLPAEITEFKDTSLGVKKQILRFYISMTYTLWVNVGKAPE